MIRLADFHLHIGREGGGNAQSRAKNFENQRVATFDELDPAAQTDAQRFETKHLLIISFDVADDRADTRRELIQTDECSFDLASGCHSDSKISWPHEKSMNPTVGGLLIGVGGLRCHQPAISGFADRNLQAAQFG